MRSDDEVRADVHALWQAVFGEPPIMEASPKFLLDVLVESIPPADYTIIRRVGDQALPLSGDGDSGAPSA